MSLNNKIDKIKMEIRQGKYTSEASVSTGIVLNILDCLGWPVFETDIVSEQYSLEGRKVDFALCHPANRPAAFIEVKKIGLSEGADRQLFEYAFHIGVPVAILTTGQEWSFYLPNEPGRYDERRVYKLDLLERDTAEASERLERYLSYKRVCSGEALKAARADYQDIARIREIEATIPKAWKALVEEHDSLLLDLLAERVEDLCGYKPDLDLCGNYLTTILVQKPIQTPRPPISPEGGVIIHPSPTGESGNFTFSFKGQKHQARSARDVVSKLFHLIAEDDPRFLERFAARKHGRKRRYLAQNKSELYPDRPDLEIHSIEVAKGWWMGTNYSRKDLQKIIDLACDVAGSTLASQIRAKVE